MERAEKPHGFLGERLYVISQQRMPELLVHPVLRGLMVTDAGCFPHARGHYRKRERGCGQTVCLVCTEGSGEVWAANTAFVLSAGQAAAIPAGTPHSYAADAASPWSLYWLHVTGDVLPGYIPRGLCSRPVDFRLPDNELISLFGQVFSFLSSGQTLSHVIAASAAASAVISRVFTANPLAPGLGRPAAERQLEPALTYIHSNLAEKLDLESLSGMCSLGISRFSFLFQRMTGLAPMQYVVRQRIQRACYYLEATSQSVSAVAELVGYEDQFYFSRMFRKITGTSPRQYRTRG